MNMAEATKSALDILRSGENFQWYVIPFIAFAIYVYYHEIQKKNWNAVAAGLSVYMVHWLGERMKLAVIFGPHGVGKMTIGYCTLIRLSNKKRRY